MNDYKKKILKILLKVGKNSLSFLKYLLKGIVLLVSFTFVLFLSLSLFTLSRGESVREIPRGIFAILGFGGFFLISMLPSVSFLCYKVDKWRDKFNDLSKKKKIKKTFLFF